MPAENEILFGELAVKNGLVSEEQLNASLLAQKTMSLMGITQPLGEIMVGKGFLTRKLLRKVRREQQRLTGKHILLGRYEMMAKIGGGGFGDVYKAKISGTDEVVAVKVLPPELARNADYVVRFRREATVAARLSHPNIVRAIGMGKSLGYYYFAMEYVEGETAAKRIDRKGSFPEPEALAVAHYVTLALQHAHGAGLVHRDVKPDNIFLTKDGAAKLGDLGLARSVDEVTRLTQPGTVIGSVYYISPEQARGDSQIDIRSDIYSLGASLYHMTTGQVPFEGSTLVSILNKHQNETLPWPAKIKRELSENICRLIATMMAKDPADRYSDPGELLVDVDLVLQGRPPAHALPAPGSTSISLDETAYIAPPVRRVLRVKPKEAPGPPDAAEPPRAVEIPLIEPAPPEAIEPFSGNVGRPLPARPARRSSCLGIIVKAALAAVIAGAIAYAMFPARMKERVKARVRSAWRSLGRALGPSAPE